MAIPQSRGAAVNNEYAAFFVDGKLYTQKLESKDEPPRELPWPWTRGQPPPVLAVSSSNLLGAASSSNIVIFDLSTCSVKLRLSTKGRAVTVLAFSPTEWRAVAAGLVDGRICVWFLDSPNRPLYLRTDSGGSCHAIAFSSNDGNKLASLHERNLYLWNCGRSNSKPIGAIQNSCLEAVAWHPTTSDRLAAASSHGKLILYELSNLNQIGQNKKNPNDDEDGSSDDGIFGELDIPFDNLQPALIRDIEADLRSVLWLNDSMLFVSSKNGLKAFIFELRDDTNEPETLWSGTFEQVVIAAVCRNLGDNLQLVSVGSQGVEFKDMPFSEDDLGSRETVATTTSQKPKTSASTYNPEQTGPVTTRNEISASTMKPVTITSSRLAASGFAKTSKQLQHRLRSHSQNKRVQQATPNGKHPSPPNDASTPPQPRSMTSSLELPKTHEEEDGSPMPFLSPTIPSRKVSPNSITPLDESTLTLPPLPEASFDSSTPLAAATPSGGQDSDDSDDDTFVDGMQGSITFLPGGINVPLPKACGALFAPSGQLLTFFPPKVRPASALGAAEPGQEVREGEGKIDKIARLFPTFGNLDTSSRFKDSESDLDSEFGQSEDGYDDSPFLRPRFVFHPASFPSQQSWKNRFPPTRPAIDSQQGLPKIVVKIHEIKDVPVLYPAQRQLAEKYRVLCVGGESGAALCEHNACVAEEFGLSDVAELWNFAANLLENKVPLDVVTFGSMSEDIMVVARTSNKLLRKDSGVDVASIPSHTGISGLLRWADHPFGGSWLVRKILTWAEQQGDVQFMAYMSAVLLEAEDDKAAGQYAPNREILTDLPTYSPDYFTDDAGYISRQIFARPVPLLRTDTVPNSPAIHRSPTKLLRHASTSTQSMSHPTTPYMESESTTPPFNFPSLSRQSTRVSTPGSVSPEINRGSFSAAAKYYAQSITDKFSSYGTSPPSKKPGTSPSTINELSSSLPIGSWAGKSVSFASTTTSNELEPQGRSFSFGFDGSGSADQAYDSDKTLDDNSAPQTPKSIGGGVAVTIKNQDLFTNELSGRSKAILLSDDLAAKAKVWSQYYAEQLRSWDLLIQASELEKVVGLTIGAPATDEAQNNDSITSILGKGPEGSSCAICFNVIRDVYQTCLSCRHVSHLECLEDYISEISDEEQFICPTGCGCLCTKISFDVQEISFASPPRPSFKRKASFTDPRKWRARVEGDSW